MHIILLIDYFTMIIGMHKTECRDLVHLKCLGPGSCPIAETCDTVCKGRHFTKGECTPRDLGEIECCCQL